MATFSTTLLEKKEIAHDVYGLRFEKPEGFDYQAGQFVQWEVPDGESMVLRSYSLSSTPADDFIEFCVKYVEGGKASEWIKSVSEGQELTFKGPQGRFVSSGEEEAIYFVATGAGLAPIIGMIADLLDNTSVKKPIVLLFGNRHAEDIIWQDRLADFADRYDNFTYQLCLSQPGDDWDGLSGHVTDHLGEDLIDKHFYLCGSLAMVKDVRIFLTKAGVDGKKIHFEIF